MPPPTGISTKSIGLIAAGILTLTFGIIIWVSVSNKQSTPNNQQNLFPTDPTEIPDITETQTGGAMFITMVDKEDPTRVAATLKADRFEPIGEGQRRLDNPESWIYLKDGRAVKITADFATMLMPDPNEPPESGKLEGNIRIEAYEPPKSSASPISPDSTAPLSPPILVARFDQPVEFERRYLRLRSPGHFDVTSPTFELAGTNLTVILNELKDRIELIDIVQGDHIIIHTDANQASKTKVASNTSTPSANPAQSSPAQPIATNSPPTTTNPSTSPATNALATNDNPQSTPVAQTEPTTPDAADPAVDPIVDLLSRYHIALHDSVIANINRAAGNSGQAAADRLDLWVALESETIPKDAIKDITFANYPPPTTTSSASSSFSSLHATEKWHAKRDGGVSPIASSVGSPIASASLMLPKSAIPESNTAQDTQPQSTPANTSNNIVITWSGKLTVRPIDGQIPQQLLNDHLTLELASNEDSGITFAVPDKDFTGQAAGLAYNATQGIVELSSKPTQAAIIKLEAKDTGSLIATSLKTNLAQGTIALAGRGAITSTPKGEADIESIATIEWKDNASFDMAMLNGSITDRLTDARFFGTVLGKQGNSTIGAKSLEATLNPELPPALSLTNLTMNQGVLSNNAKSMLAGNSLDIDFTPSQDSKTVDPSHLRATGKVFARTPDSTLNTDELMATMYRDLENKLAVRTADAKDNIKYTGPDRTTAQGSILSVQGQSQTMTLLGSPAKLTQAKSSVVGNHINLNAKRRAIEVLGPGSFDHDIAIENTDASQPTHTAPTGHIRATWKGSMRFDDALGSIICQDQVRVISTPDAYTIDSLNAHRAEIKLTTRPTNDPLKPISPSTSSTPDREFLTAKVFGHAPAGQDPIPAKIESRTYAHDDPERVVGLIYLDGPQILIDNQAQTLDVPAAGTLLIMDRDETQDQPQDQTAQTSPGLTRFTWQGNMSLDRTQGTAHFVDQVVVRQKTISTGKLASLTTDQLDARFEFGQLDESNKQTTRLLGVDAVGAVRFMFEGKELIADRTEYDAITDSLFASAFDNKLVTLYDDSQPAPMSAKTMKWELEKDRIEINAPTPTRSIGG